MTRILLVDDESNIRTMVRLALERKTVIVEVAENGYEALEMFGNGSTIDLVLLDQRMPGIDGLTVLREMHERRPSVRVVMISAFGTIELAMQAREQGATDFLRKPFTVETLRRTVDAALNVRLVEVTKGEVFENAGTPIPSGLIFTMTTINGFRIEYEPGTGLQTGEDTLYTFHVSGPDGEVHPCTVLLPNYMKELIKCYADREIFPGGRRFWEAACEDVLANYLWTQAEYPVGGVLRVDELTHPIKAWVDAVLSGSPGQPVKDG